MKIHEYLSKKDNGIGGLFRASLMLWGSGGLRRLVFFLLVAWRMRCASRRRERNMCRLGNPIPYVLAISPTMHCNYRCKGCYSHGRSTGNELSAAELETLLTEAEELGVFVILVTGGEPLLRADLLNLIARHRRLFFVLITNGSLLTPAMAQLLARSGNVVTLVSIDGGSDDTDSRRCPGAHAKAQRGLEMLREAGAFSGFAATVAAANADHLATDTFVDEMVGLGCSVGYFTEYVPCGEDVRTDWVLEIEARNAFRERVLDLRRRKPIILIQFPQDEYGEDNRCLAAGRGSLHINAQGGVEPCPFVPIACENVRRGGLITAFQSPFLRAIRQNPELLRPQRFACALFEYHAEIETLATQYRAQPVGEELTDSEKHPRPFRLPGIDKA